MKKLTLLMAAIFALVAFPAVAAADTNYSADADPAEVNAQTATDSSDLTVNVLAAIELTAMTSDTQSDAPEAGGTSGGVTLNVDGDIRSNLAWAVTSSAAEEDLDQVVATTTGASLLNDLVNTDTATDSGARNTSNSVQSYDEQYTQEVSWGDEAGAYDVTLQHSAAQSLPTP